MLYCSTLHSLLLAWVCLSIWAAPLGNIQQPLTNGCNGHDQEPTQTSISLAEQRDVGQQCLTITEAPSSAQPVEEHGRAQTVRENAEDIANAGQEGEAPGNNEKSQGVLAQKEADASVQCQGNCSATENPLWTSDEKGRKSSLSPVPSETFAGMDQRRSSGYTPKESLYHSFTATVLPSDSRSFTMAKSTPLPKPTGFSLGAQMEKQMAPEPKESEQDGSSLHYVGEMLGEPSQVWPDSTSPSQEREDRWTTQITQLSTEKLSSLQKPGNRKGAMTELTPLVYSSGHESVSHPPPILTTLTAWDSTTEEAGGFSAGPFRAPNAPFSVTTGPQERVLSPGLIESAGTWTEPVHLQGEEASELPFSQEEIGTEATMSSEDLPLIFEPFDDVTSLDVSATVAPMTGMLAEAELEQMASMDTEHATSDVSLLGDSDWTSPWQMSGAESSDAVTQAQQPISTELSGAETDHVEWRKEKQNPDTTMTSDKAPPPSSASTAASGMTQIPAVAKATPLPTPKPKSGLEELEYEEELDEDEDEEDASEEEESEEDVTEVPVSAPVRPTYSLIPPPPVWVQRNQGLVRSWVELIREKAGYVSGMLAPVGIGIAGALLFVGALYSIRQIHRRRRNNFKHQRRKQPSEVRNGPDQAMLLADSSEDEF